MRHHRISTVLAIALALVALPALAGGEHEHPIPAPDLGGLQNLVGAWEAAIPGGGTAHASYELVAGGSALVEHLQMGDEPAMVTVYYRDGSDLMLTHYCTAQNQPRMRAQRSGDKTLDFAFVDATNLPDMNVPHMDHVTMELVDADNLNQTWTFSKDGKADSPMLLKYQRVK